MKAFLHCTMYLPQPRKLAALFKTSKFRKSFRIVVRIFAGTFAYNFKIVKTIALSKIRRKFGDISFRSKNRWFSSKSGEMSRNSSKFALISFAQYCILYFSIYILPYFFCRLLPINNFIYTLSTLLFMNLCINLCLF